jgi:vancomycin permeability regulator SanA
MTPVIIIFGAALRPDGSPSGAMRSRVEAALETARRLKDPLFMPTGGQGRYGGPEAEIMADLLAAESVPRSRITPEPTGRNTIRSVLACARLLGRTRAPVYVATSAYHMLRCVLLLRLAGLRARPCRPPRGPASARWVKRWFWRLREVPAVPVDSLLMLWIRLRGHL